MKRGAEQGMAPSLKTRRRGSRKMKKTPRAMKKIHS
jgi:hypothetical protein